MADNADDLEKLLLDVRKVIHDNKQFLEKLADETISDNSDDESETIIVDEGFEEL